MVSHTCPMNIFSSAGRIRVPLPNNGQDVLQKDYLQGGRTLSSSLISKESRAAEMKD
jgi:hypothetical protein